MARITGIGGVFFKSRNDSAKLAAWYQKHLGMPLESFGGAVLKWLDDKAEDQGLTVWHIAERESRWFSPSDSPFMINYRVDNLSEMIAQLSRGGVEVIGGPESHENGKFAWILDPEGNKVELWEPILERKEQKCLSLLPRCRPTIHSSRRAPMPPSRTKTDGCEFVHPCDI